MKFINILITITILLFFKNVNSQSLELQPGEYDCFYNLATKMDSIGDTPTDANGYYEFCSYTNNPSILLNCDQSKKLIISLSITQISPPTTILNSTDFQCLSTTTKSVTLYNPTLSDDFFETYSLSTSLTIDTITNPNSIVFSPILDSGYPFILKMYQQTTPTTIPFTYLPSNYTAIANDHSVLSTTSHNIIYTNDYPFLVPLKLFNVVSKNVPSFVNTRIQNVSIQLVPGFDRQSLISNITTIGGATQLFTIVSPESIPFPTTVNQITGTFLSVLTLDSNFDAPSSIIDLSVLVNVQELHFKNVGALFSYNQKVPFIFPTGKTVEFSGGKINTFDITVYNNPTSLIVKNNQMSGTLPSIRPSSLKGLDIQNNQMTGSIDSSYCKLSTFAFQNNSFNGKIPSCFTCYFNTALNLGFSNLFLGNNFETPPTTCTTIVPNIGFLVSNPGSQVFEIFGEDLGFSSFINVNNIKVIGYTFSVFLDEGSTHMVLTILSTQLPKIIKLSYEMFSPPKVFTLAWDPLQPQIETVNWSNDLDLQFDGSYFSYNTSIMSIVVGGQNCLITSTTFNQINCSILNAVTPGSKTIITFVTVGTLTTQITLNPNVLNIIKNCTADYNDCNNGGYCNTEFATCICDQNHQGPACDLPFKQCPSTVNGLCNNQGNCNNQTSICSCNGQYQGIDCGTTFKECPMVGTKVCNEPLGSCQNVTGTCLCNDPSITNNNCLEIECADPLCSSNGVCNKNFGVCVCNPSHQGVDCDLPFKQCPSTINGLCNNQGNCNNQTSICSCNNQYQGLDCGTTFKECPMVDTKVCNEPLGSCQNVTGTCICNDPSIINNNCLEVECIDPLCSSHGSCNKNFGMCVCDKIPNEWSGSTCSTPLQTMSSVTASSTLGGEAIFYGWFGNVHDTPSLLIGNKDCPITSINETVIICTAPAGTGIQTVKFTQNLNPYIVNNFYEYSTIAKSCPNDCTSKVNGKCDTITGYCKCNSNWGGYDCSLYRNDNTGSDSGNNGGNFPSTNITINGTNGNTNLNNQQTNYEISITSLIEFDLSGNQIKNYPLLNSWSVKTENNITKDIYQFIQTIQNGVCNITFILEDIKTTRNISFAGLQYQLESGSVKMTITIDNYQYSSNLNTLQLQMKSIVSEVKSNDSNDCNNENIEINTVGDYDNSLNYLSIKKNAKVLSGRFINRVESDGRSTYSQTTIVSKSNDTVIIGMNLPHFIQSITIDPDFSVLISPDFKSECDNSKRNWVIPVAVCASVAGAAAIGASAFLIHRKLRVEMPFSNKMKKLSKLG